MFHKKHIIFHLISNFFVCMHGFSWFFHVHYTKSNLATPKFTKCLKKRENPIQSFGYFRIPYCGLTHQRRLTYILVKGGEKCSQGLSHKSVGRSSPAHDCFALIPTVAVASSCFIGKNYYQVQKHRLHCGWSLFLRGLALAARKV